jgi:hypothetical protein
LTSPKSRTTSVANMNQVELALAYIEC